MRNKPTPVAPSARSGRVHYVVHVGQQFDADTVALDRFLIAVLNQAMAQIDVFALQLAIGPIGFRPGLTSTPPSRPSTTSMSPLWTSFISPCKPDTAGIPSERARIAACPVEPPASVTIPATGRRSNIVACDGRISAATRMTG